MIESKHTPGDWKVRFFREDDPEAGFFVEAANNNKPELGYGIEIMMEDFGDHNGYTLEQRLADAKLIAASPKMLKAIELLLDGKIEEAGEAARAAVAGL